MSSTGWRTSRRGKASAASKQSVNSGSQPKTSKSGASKAEDDVPVNYGNKKTATMLSTVLDKCQKSRQAFHPSAMTVKKYIQGDPKTLTAVCKSFCHFLERCLPVYKKSDPVDRIIEFLGQLCKHLDSPLNDHFGIEIVAVSSRTHSKLFTTASPCIPMDHAAHGPILEFKRQRG